MAIAVAGVPPLFDSRTWLLLSAVRELGPLSGWRCAELASYVYDPNHERADATLLAEPPENVVLDQIPDLEVDSVEVDLRAGDAVVSTHLSQPASSERRLVYVLSPGRLRAVTFQRDTSRETICSSQMAEWRIIGEHYVG